VSATTAGDRLRAVLTATDALSIDQAGDLHVEDRHLSSLLDEFGSPMFVLSERTLRANYRRLHRAFASAWAESIRVLYAIKANNNLAVRSVMHSEGAGGDCFGLGELYATLAGGADPDTLVLNGSNKTETELDAAVSLGMRVNIDSEDEIATLERLCAERKTRARVAIRLKVAPHAFDSYASDFFDVPEGHLREAVEREKWGFGEVAATDLVLRIAASDHLVFEGYHLHLGRLGQDPGIYRAWASELGATVRALTEKTAISPRVLNIGGGWPRERDPESRSRDPNRHTIEEYANAVAHELEDQLTAAGIPLPELWLEPGRYLVGNAGLLLGRVGAVKRDLGRTWVNVDFSTNNLTRIDSAGASHHVVPVSRLLEPARVETIVVGGTCALSVIAEMTVLPALARGDGIAVLDAGMYAETTSNQYNAVPRPATVLVNGSEADVVRERETIADVFATQRLPKRLRKPQHPEAARLLESGHRS